MTLAIIVVNFASHELLADNLARLGPLDGDTMVVVVDNFSSAVEVDAVRKLATRHGWSPLFLAKNVGFGAAVNAGVESARQRGARDLLFLNPDAAIEVDSIRALVHSLEPARFGLASPVISTGSGDRWFAGSDLYLTDGVTRSRLRRADHPGERREAWLTGACLFTTTETWDAVGGFDESYFLYWEDVDLSWRVREAGGQLLLVEGASAVHDEGGTQRIANHATRAKSTTYYYFNIRNRMLFATLNLDERSLRRWLRSSPRIAWQVLLRGGRRQFLHPVAPLRAAWAGLRDGRAIARSRLRDAHSSEPLESGPTSNR